jgi:5-methyltetrahydropteroyltriglutamate--homocysteine methyltransferase
MTPWSVYLPTTVVGSYSVPEWLERLKTEYYQRRISAAHLGEIYEVAIKAAVKDQELAGIDIVSDGELRRDNDIDYFLARVPGVHIAQRAKSDYYDYYEAEVTAPLPEDDKTSLGLAADFAFTRTLTDRPIKFSFTGPFSLSRRVTDTASPSRGRCTSATATAMPGPPGRGTTTSCSPPCWPPGWTSSSWSSPARAWRTCT